MNLIEVSMQAEYCIRCKVCGRWIFNKPEQDSDTSTSGKAWADLDGTAFVDYYCDRCKEVLDFKEHDMVVLKEDLPGIGKPAGTSGAIVHVNPAKGVFILEFPDNETEYVSASKVRKA